MTRFNNIRGIIFDMDGTLIDSLPVWKKSAQHIADKYNIPYDDEVQRYFIQYTTLEVGKYLKNRFSLNFSAQYLSDEINCYIADKYRYEIQLKPSVSDAVRLFYSKGIKMAVATASERSLAQAVLERTGIIEYLEGIVVCSEVGREKHFPDVYYAAQRLLKTSTDKTVVFEDAFYAVRTAKNAGYTVFAVKDKYSDSANKIKSVADVYIRDYKELFDMCKQ